MTPGQIARVARDWAEAAGESVRVELLGDALYGFCSELGALRLFHKYRFAKPDKVQAGKSPEFGWFFQLNMNPDVVRYLKEAART